MFAHNYTHSELIHYCLIEQANPVIKELAERLEASEDELKDYDETLEQVAVLEGKIEKLEGKEADYDSAVKSLQMTVSNHSLELDCDWDGEILDLLDPILEKFENLMLENKNLHALLSLNNNAS